MMGVDELHHYDLYSRRGVGQPEIRRKRRRARSRPWRHREEYQKTIQLALITDGSISFRSDGKQAGGY
jgi:hypothetical protein